MWSRSVPATPFSSTGPISTKDTGAASAAWTTAWLTSTSPGLAYSAILAARFTVRVAGCCGHLQWTRACPWSRCSARRRQGGRHRRRVRQRIATKSAHDLNQQHPGVDYRDDEREGHPGDKPVEPTASPQ
jgi:hypothetical protein